jgi:hypothetical protein
MWKHHGTIRPRPGSDTLEATDSRYGLYDKPFKQYAYTAAFVRKCAGEVDTQEKWRAVFAKDPVAKVTSIETPAPVEKSKNPGVEVLVALLGLLSFELLCPRDRSSAPGQR